MGFFPRAEGRETLIKPIMLRLGPFLDFRLRIGPGDGSGPFQVRTGRGRLGWRGRKAEEDGRSLETEVRERRRRRRSPTGWKDAASMRDVGMP